MSSTPRVVIVIARCNRNKQNFGIRFEEKAEGRWIGDWAFAVTKAHAQKEGYEQNTISGTFALDNAYPGCPYCHARSIFKSGCGKVNCWDGETRVVTCAWCEHTDELEGQIKTLSVEVGY